MYVLEILTDDGRVLASSVTMDYVHVVRIGLKINSDPRAVFVSHKEVGLADIDDMEINAMLDAIVE